MRTIIHYLIVFFITLCTFTACNKMDSTYKKYIVLGGVTYPEKANFAKVYNGHNRVKITWPRGSDPKVIKARIFWNNYTDSVEVNIPSTGDTISTIIENLPEKSYFFIVKTYDVKGHSSVPVELLSATYGDQYQSNLLSRPVNSSAIDANNKLTIQWDGADITNGAFVSEIKYTDILGNIKYQRFPINESSSIISDLMPGTSYQYRTVFKPDSLSLDEYFTNYSMSTDFTFDKKDWKIIAYSTQHDAGSNRVNNFIDGTDGTRWHSLAGGSNYPHFATIDMGSVRLIKRFGVWRTTFENGGDNRAPDRIQFLVSTDNLIWTDLGVFDFNRNINGEQAYIIPSNPSARYVKFVAVQGPENNMVIGEISAYGF